MITDIVLRFSGTVDFTDGTHQKFGAIYQDGALVDPDSAGSLEAFKQLWAQRNGDIDALLELLGGTFTITTGAPTTQKTVSDWTMLLCGTISRSDGSSGSFDAVYDVKGGSRVTGTTVFDEVLADSTYKAILDSTVEAVAGSGKVAIVA